MWVRLYWEQQQLTSGPKRVVSRLAYPPRRTNLGDATRALAIHSFLFMPGPRDDAK
jgi:hypothetical protein